MTDDRGNPGNFEVWEAIIAARAEGLRIFLHCCGRPDTVTAERELARIGDELSQLAWEVTGVCDIATVSQRLELLRQRIRQCASEVGFNGGEVSIADALQRVGARNAQMAAACSAFEGPHREAMNRFLKLARRRAAGNESDDQRELYDVLDALHEVTASFVSSLRAMGFMPKSVDDDEG